MIRSTLMLVAFLLALGVFALGCASDAAENDTAGDDAMMHNDDAAMADDTMQHEHDDAVMADHEMDSEGEPCAMCGNDPCTCDAMDNDGEACPHCGNDPCTCYGEDDDMHQEKTAVPVNNANCPVMGGAIAEGMGFDYNGWHIGICCAGCEAMFKNNPDAYIANLQAETGIDVSVEPQE